MPGELGSLAALETLDLSGNRLSGSIPGELGQLTGLYTLDLSGNRLTGSIPPELAPTATGGLSVLKDLRLHHNDLTGELPLGIRYEAGHTPVLTSLESLSLDPEQIGVDGMSVLVAAVPVYLDLPDDPTPDYADSELTYVSWVFIDRFSNADDFADLNQIQVPTGATLADEDDREFYRVSLELFDTAGSSIAGGRLPEPATICVANDVSIQVDPQRLLGLREGSASWRLLPQPDTDPTVFQDACGLTRDPVDFRDCGWFSGFHGQAVGCFVDADRRA